MVGVFVGDQDGVEVADLGSDRAKPREGFAFSEPGIHEDAGAFGFEQRQIARAAGRKNRNAQTDGIAPCLQPPCPSTALGCRTKTSKMMAERADSVNEQQTCLLKMLQPARRSRVRVKPLSGPRTVTAICSGLKNS